MIPFWKKATPPPDEERRPPPEARPPEGRTIPDTPPVRRENYLNAWHELLATENGRIVVAQLRYYIWSEAGWRLPQPASFEHVALETMRHDGRMEILDRLVQEATHNLKLLPPRADTVMRPVGRVNEEGLYE